MTTPRNVVTRQARRPSLTTDSAEVHRPQAPAHAAGAWTTPLVPGVTFEVVLVTSELAEDWLSRVPARQRRRSDKTVEKYTNDMVTGEFLFVGDPVRFNVNDECVDGQHRLKGIIESGVPQPLLVIRGLAPAAIHSMDSGRVRNFADSLRIEGVPRHQAVAAITNRLWHWDHGNYGQTGIARTRDSIHTNTAPTRHMLWATFRANADLPTSAYRAQHLASYLPNAPASIFGLAWMLFGRIDPDLREKFFWELEKGSSENSPEYPMNVLRRSLTRRITETTQVAAWVWLAYTLRTWNAWLGGESLSYLRMPTPVRWDTLPQPKSPGDLEPQDASAEEAGEAQ